MLNNPTLNTLLSHRSIRRFTQEKIASDVLNTIIQAGQAASTSSFLQTVSIVQVRDLNNKKKLAQMCGNQPYVASCAEFLVCCADWQRNEQMLKGEVESENFSTMEALLVSTVDTAIFAQNMVVAAESLGLGCCYIGGIRNEPESVSTLLNLPELVYPVFGLCIGYPDQDPLLRPRLPQKIIHHIDGYQPAKKTDLVDYNKSIQSYYQSRSQAKVHVTWREQMKKLLSQKMRQHFLSFLQSRGFAKK